MNDTMDAKLRQLQLTQLEILKVIDRVCRKHSISYSLYAGTLLGAVRHHGFIPWDDDLDICMSRSEYQRFMRVWSEDPPAGYLLQNKENTAGFSQSFSKIRQDHTCFLETEWEVGRHHAGIFVDIFPIDRMPVGRVEKTLFQLRCLQYQLLTREYLPPGGSPLQKIASAIILATTPAERRSMRRKELLNQIVKYNGCESLPAVAIETMSTIRTPLPANFMTDFTEIMFEDNSFMCSAAWDEYLTVKFGDYMKLPPENERTWRHHPIILDFSRNYEELTEEEKRQ